MAIDNDTSYELTGAQIKDLAQKIRNKADDNTFVGSSSGVAGSKGLVPAPAAGDQDKFLKGDGSWATVSGGGDEVVTYYVDDNGSNDLRDLYKNQSISINNFQYFYLESDPYTLHSAYDVFQEIAGGQKTRFVFKDPNQFFPITDEVYATSDIARYDSVNQTVIIRAEFGYWGNDGNTTRRIGDTTMTAVLELDPNDGIKYQDSEPGRPLMLYMNYLDFAIQTSSSTLTGDYVFSSAELIRGLSQGSTDGDLANELGAIVTAAIKAGNRVILKLYNEWSDIFGETYPNYESFTSGGFASFAIKQGSNYPATTQAFGALASQRPGELTCYH